ncbi:MAG: rRNA (guanine-N1)-methyltransferase [Oceanospirillum sp.]|nr:rRNA (guanine-N1)-methyltransferase [Oceanospirillum sp.]
MAHQITAQNLICPLDQQPLIQQDNSLRCNSGHSFDIARQGYVNLLPVQKKRSKDPGDSKEMIIARQNFLNAGLYHPISEQLNQLVSPLIAEESAASILDAGCGEGYYLDQLASSLSEGHNLIGLDISKWAVQAAARRNKQITWIVGTNVQLPVAPNSLDMLICMFGFYDLEKFTQWLKPGGYVVLAEAGKEHLIELRELIYPEVRRTPLPDISQALENGYQLAEEKSLQFKPATLNKKQITDLMVMTPHLYRASYAGKQAAEALTELDITADVVFRVLQYN